jgi:protein-S-isoprenylcysteine O-methyltransferase Ste14
MLRWVSFLATAEMAVFFDYGHWRLVRALQRPVLQGIGLALSAAGVALLFWVDHYLARHFASGLAARKLINEGPYHYMRHPRYAALLLSRIALALALASVLGWVLALAWLLLILRRIRLEEAHLRELFPADYDAYAARTARLLPRIY